MTLASEDGQIEIYSLAEHDKGKVIFSIKIPYNIKEHGPVTKIMYHKDVGLVASMFKGMLQIYDSMEFKLLWESTSVNMKEKITITTFDFSSKAGLIAVGGVEGKIAVFDPSAKVLTA